MAAATSVNDSDLIYLDQVSLTTKDTKVTAAQLKSYIQNGVVLISTINQAGGVEGYDATLLKSANIGASVEAWNAKLDAYAALAAPGAIRVLQIDASGNLSVGRADRRGRADHRPERDGLSHGLLRRDRLRATRSTARMARRGSTGAARWWPDCSATTSARRCRFTMPTPRHGR